MSGRHIRILMNEQHISVSYGLAVEELRDLGWN